MTTQPDDEKTIRTALIAMGVGPNGSTQPAIPPMPTRPPAAPPPTAQAAKPQQQAPAQPKASPPKPKKPKPTAAKPKKQKPAAPQKPQASKPRKTRKARFGKREKPKQHNPNTPRSAWDTQPPAPRQSLVEAWDRVPYRLKWLAYHASAAYLGWMVGIVGWVTYVTAWIAATGLVGPQAIFWYAVGAAALLLHHATRRRWRPVAWLAAVPASSVVVGVLLYGVGYHR